MDAVVVQRLVAANATVAGIADPRAAVPMRRAVHPAVRAVVPGLLAAAPVRARFPLLHDRRVVILTVQLQAAIRVLDRIVGVLVEVVIEQGHRHQVHLAAADEAPAVDDAVALGLVFVGHQARSLSIERTAFAGRVRPFFILTFSCCQQNGEP